MLPVSTPAEFRIVSGKKRGFFHRKVERLFSPELFHLRLLIDPVIDVLVTIVLAVTPRSSGFEIGNQTPVAIARTGESVFSEYVTSFVIK